MGAMQVGVIFGGRSVEHDVSIVTAHQAMSALAGRHEVVPIYVTREGAWLWAPELFDLDVYKQERWAEVGERAYIPPVAGFGGLVVPGGRFKGERKVSLDVVIPAIHGTFGEDGTLQGLLELAGIPYAGSGLVGSTVGMDKPTMKAVFAAAGLPVLDHVVVDARRLPDEASEVVGEIEAAVGYPAFVKPARLGSSVGIGKARDRDALMQALEVARRYDRRLLVEPSAEGCIEVNCSVLGGHGRSPRASVCEQPVQSEDFLSFDDKYLRGSKDSGSRGMASLQRRIPAPISDAMTGAVQSNAIAAFEAIDAAGVARVDAFVDEASEQTWVMEINTTPGSFSFYLWERDGLGFPDLMQELIDIALAGYRERDDLMFTFESGMLRSALKGAKSSG